MNFNKRLIIQFIMQHVFVLVTLLIAVVVAFTYLIFLLTSTLYEPNIPILIVLQFQDTSLQKMGIFRYNLKCKI